MYEIFNKSESKRLRKELRESQTKAERLVWSRVRSSKIGFKFRRQQGIGPYIVDFYCADVGLVVEIDGSIHFDDRLQEEKDQRREKYLQHVGMTVLRFTNDKVYRDLDGIIITIRDACRVLGTCG